ncbi:PAS domain S-box protein [Kamptonema sp. UHCC 0994]|uniref:PAS domain S-box protein n=1 Tax=Kamptonema sp. UHCC 0994 TaxID=3031329 RepID=UPI0023BA1CE3|nr:PAS domain S-box protein [Kamptonema sp. UHCC 0994]MDF0554182.1 PAS domain S-box protein [Kamptonema sp. UHCC 0994]
MQTRANYHYPETETNSCVSKVHDLNSDIEWCRAESQAIPRRIEHICFLADALPVVIWMSDASSRYTFLNQRCLEFTDRSLGETLESAWEKSVHPEDLQQCLAAYRQAIEVGSDFQAEYRIRCRNGEYRWILDTGVPQQTAEGTSIGYVGTSLDITERKQLEEELKKYRNRINELIAERTAELMFNNSQFEQEISCSNQSTEELDPEISEQFPAIFEQGAVGISNVNPQDKFIRVNRRFCEIVGYSESELLEMRFQQISHPEDLEANENFRQACLANQIQSYSLEKRLIRKDGSLVWVNLTVSIVRDAMMRPEYNIAVIEDIATAKVVRTYVTPLSGRLGYRLEGGVTDISPNGDRERCLGMPTPPFPSCMNTEVFDIKKTATWEWTRFDGRTYQSYNFPFTDIDGSQLVMELGIDISEGKQVVSALRQSQEMLQLVIDNIPQAICWKDRNSVYLGCNRTAAADAGLASCQDIIGLTDWDLPWTKEQAESFRKGDRRVMETDTPQYRILQPQLQANGQLAWLDTNKIPLHDTDGNVVGILITYEDITPHKQAQEEIIEGAQRLSTVIETVGEGITLSDADGNFIIYNSRMEELTGYSKTEAEIAGDFLRLLYPDPHAHAAALNGIREMVITAGFRDVETAIVTKEGKQKTLLVSTSLMQYKNRSLFLSAYRDISHRVEAQEAQRQAEEKYRSLFENALEGIFQTTIDGHYLNANPALARIYGYSTPQELMVRLTDIERQLYVEPNRRTEFIRRLQEDDAVSGFESQVYRSDGTVIWISENARAVRDRHGTALYYEGTVEDITERKRLEEERRQQAERERLISKIAQRIRSSLDLRGILSVAVAEVREFLQTDRVLIYRCEPDGSRIVAVESVGLDWQPMLDVKVLDAGFAKSMFVGGQIQAVEDIYQADLPQSYVDLLAQFQVRANLVMPIALQGLGGTGAFEQESGGVGVQGGTSDSYNLKLGGVASATKQSQNSKLANSQPWGLLVAHHCKGSRHWQPQEMDLLKQLAAQLAIAISQAELYQRLRDANQELKRIATLDGLTLIPNRRCFDEYLECEWARSQRDQTPLSLILCDVDFFKLYNDTYGHQAGDSCLKKVAAALNRSVERCLRRVGEWDTGKVSEDENLFLAARYGGEEFAVILPNRDSASALRAAKAIRCEMESLRLPHAKSSVSKYVTLSMGIATTVADSEVSVKLMILAADKALYRAKEQGRDRIVLS